MPAMDFHPGCPAFLGPLPGRTTECGSAMVGSLCLLHTSRDPHHTLSMTCPPSIVQPAPPAGRLPQLPDGSPLPLQLAQTRRLWTSGQEQAQTRCGAWRTPQGHLAHSLSGIYSGEQGATSASALLPATRESLTPNSVVCGRAGGPMRSQRCQELPHCQHWSQAQ